jgi:hypothetical protein
MDQYYFSQVNLINIFYSLTDILTHFLKSEVAFFGTVFSCHVVSCKKGKVVPFQA